MDREELLQMVDNIIAYKSGPWDGPDTWFRKPNRFEVKLATIIKELLSPARGDGESLLDTVYVSVPQEPTIKMCNAGAKSLEAGGFPALSCDAAEAYRAMLDATPTPPSAEGEPETRVIYFPSDDFNAPYFRSKPTAGFEAKHRILREQDYQRLRMVEVNAELLEQLADAYKEGAQFAQMGHASPFSEHHLDRMWKLSRTYRALSPQPQEDSNAK